MTAPAIELENLTFAWPGRPALLHISALAIRKGERVFLQGPSGSGKSTLLGLIGGVLAPTGGVIRVNGTALNELGPAERDEFRGNHIGFIFQMFNLIPYLSVRDNVLLPFAFSPRRRARIPVAQRADEAARLLSSLGLDAADVLPRPVTQLSVGQQQRVAAARALIARPDVLIADEPTSALDADTREEFLRLLLRECAESATTLLFVSHDSSLAAHFDRSLAMTDFRAPRLPEVAA